MKKYFLILFFCFFMLAGSAQAALPFDPDLSKLQNPLQGTVPNPGPGNLSYTPLEPLYAYESVDINTNNLGSIFNNIFRLLISLGALFAVVTLVVGGIMYMTSEATGTKDLAKKRITSSIYGLLLLAASYLILSTINPQLTFINLQPGLITGKQTSPIPGSQPTTPGQTGQPTDVDRQQCESQFGIIQIQPDGTWRCVNPTTGFF